jgi:hypothetical protein
VGLLLKGYDNKQNQKDSLAEASQAEVKPDEETPDPDGGSPGILTNIINKLDGIFKENDSTLQ